MTIIEKLNYIIKRNRLYNIYFRNAGVALQFYNPPKEFDGDDLPIPFNWRKYLTPIKYHKTFEDAVNYEYEKINET